MSTATISRVLNNTGYVSEQVRLKVNETIKRLNYQPNLIARSLKQKKTGSIGIILPDMTNEYFMTIARNIQSTIIDAGYHLLYMDSEQDPDKEYEALNFLMEKRVEAIILAGTGQNITKLRAIIASGIHVILIDRRIDGLRADVIAEDSRAVSEEAIDYLIDKGHERIGIVSGPRAVITASERYEGVMNGLAKRGVAVNAQYIYEGDFTRQSGIHAARYLMALDPRPTAIFSANNEMTHGLYLGFHELGMPTDEVEVVSFGDLGFTQLFRNKLSVIRQTPEELGRYTGDILLKRVQEDPDECDSCILYPQLIQKF